MVDRNEALRELARRELARRQAPVESQQSQELRSELSSMTQNPDTAAFNRQQYENLPGWQKPIVAASDVGQLTAKGAMNMFGISPEKVAATVRAPFTGRSYEDELRDQKAFTQRARDRAGSAATGAEVVGGATAGLGAARNGLTLLRGGVATAPGIGGVAARTGLMGIEGAGYGAANAFANDQDITEGAMYGAAGGAGGNLISEAATSLLSKAAGAFNKKPSIPGKDELIALKDAAYDVADRSGVVFTPNAVDRVGRKVVSDLTDIGFDPALQPGAAAALKRIRELGGQNVTLKGLDTIRKIASNGYIPGNQSNNLAISKIIEAIDDVTTKPGAKDILMGDKGGLKALQEARKYASRVAKLEKVERAVQLAELRAGSTGSGGNVDNATRQNLRRLLEKPRGFTADEQAALTNVVKGTGGQNMLRLAGKLSPSGNGLMAALGIGGTMVNPAIGALSLGGMGAKAAADRMTQSNVKALTDIIAAGGSKSATQAAKNTVQKLAESKRDAIARGLLSYAILNSRREEAPAK